jgi:hypothetical protein
MLQNIDLTNKLNYLRNKVLTEEDQLLHQAHTLLKQEQFTVNQIIENLSLYNKNFENLDERVVVADQVYSLSLIKELAIKYRLKFLETKSYKSEIPYTAVLKTKYLNELNRKEINSFKILAPAEAFLSSKTEQCTLLFAKTNEENYYLIHQWGKNLSWYRKWLYLPLQRFENLVTTVFLITLTLTLCLPTSLITLDDTADYWSGYRAATFFHLLIFNFGVTVYFTFTLAKNFSDAIWNQIKDFD